MHLCQVELTGPGPVGRRVEGAQHPQSSGCAQGLLRCRSWVSPRALDRRAVSFARQECTHLATSTARLCHGQVPAALSTCQIAPAQGVPGSSRSSQPAWRGDPSRGSESGVTPPTARRGLCVVTWPSLHVLKLFVCDEIHVT